ncbi:MAG TPA: hypothetical protein GXZ21_02650 [Clostridiales bacterium]|nr:hypothetical protein [Clostridiales bacterium]
MQQFSTFFALLKITPEYETLYEAIYDYAETDNNNGINTKTYTTIADALVKVEVKKGEVIYKIKSDD